MIGTNTVNTRWSSKIKGAARRQWQLLRNESAVTNRIARSYRRFFTKNELDRVAKRLANGLGRERQGG